MIAREIRAQYRVPRSSYPNMDDTEILQFESQRSVTEVLEELDIMSGSEEVIKVHSMIYFRKELAKDGETGDSARNSEKAGDSAGSDPEKN